MIAHKNGDLFSVEIEKNDQDSKTISLLLHACNCQGSWRSGVADEFRKRFPHAHSSYQNFCRALAKEKNTILGSGVVFSNLSKAASKYSSHHNVACLFTSWDYGQRKDVVSQIEDATYHSVVNLLSRLKPGTKVIIHSPKINAGLFAVPWEKTEAAIEKAILTSSHVNVSWTVWSL